MDQNCLANTGYTLTTPTIIALLLIVLAIFTMAWRKPNKIYHLAIMLVLGFTTFSAVTMPVSAASTDCRNGAVLSVADTTTGLAGQTQIGHVLGNDTASPGASFIGTSLRLSLPSGHVLGASVSSDGKTVTLPGEGTFQALDNFTIVFTPEPAFVGKSGGVIYTITDTSGYTASNTYTPTVTSAPVAVCSDPASETRILAPIVISYVSGVDEYTFDDWLAMSGNSPLLDPLLLDLNPAVSGRQTTLSYPLEGWSASYNPATDQFTLTVTDWIAFYTTVDSGYLFSYTVVAAPGCNQPAAGDISIIIIG